MKRNCKTKVNKGFTLVEMLMVIAILTVLLAFAVPGVSSYTRRIRLMELDDSARSIFMAAQNRLVSLKSAGVTNLTFEDKSSEIEYESIPDNFFPKDEENKKIEVDKASVDMRYITSDEIKSIGADEPNIIGLGGGASNISTIEDNLLQNDFIIEYEANTGYVFGVFYCEEDGKLADYDPSGIHRDFEQRLVDGGFIGYYGGGELVNSLPAANPQQKPQVEKSSNEKLALTIEFPEDYEQDKVYFSVTITGYDFRAYGRTGADKEQFKHTVAIISKDDKCFIKKPMNEGDDTSCTVILDSIAPGMSSDTDKVKSDYYGWWLPKSPAFKDGEGNSHYDLSDWIIERDFKGWVYAGYFPRKDWNTPGLDSNNGKLEDFYLLDSEDCFKHYVEFDAAYPIGGDVKYDGITKKWSRWDYTIPEGCAGYDAANPKQQEALNDDNHQTSQNPYVYYIIDPGSDITVDYKFYDVNGVSIDAKGDSWTTNSYFEKLENGGTSDGIAYVSAGRHLQNLAFYTDSKLISKAYISNSIDFSEDHTGQPDCYEYWNSSETNKGTERAKNLYDFVPIDNKFVGLSQAPDILPDPNASDEIMIKYIRIDSTTYNDGKDDTLDTFTAANHETTGFFTTTLNREMTGLVFYCPVVIGGGEYTGSVVGKSANNGVHLKNVTVINPIVEGPGFVGGICGAWTSSEFSNNRVLIQEVDNYFDNYESDYTKRKFKGPVVWGNPKEDPYAKFYVKGTSEDSYAGGLIGCATGQVQKASAAIKVESLGYAGGLIGVSSGGTFSKNFVGGHTYNGQFAGVLEDGTKYALKNISGEKGAGGIIGKVASYIDLDKDTVAEAVVGEGEITLNGAYSTCSVYSPSPNLKNADVMVGSGKYYAQNNSYGAGWIVDSEGKKVSQAPRGGELNPQLAAYGNEVCFEAYDEFITKFYEKYPYFPQGAEHIGDWPVDPPVFGVFYWEKAGGEIRYKAIGYNAVLNENIINDTLSDSGEITDYGYGYFYSKTTEADENKLKSLGEDNREVSSDMKTALEEYIAKEEGVGCSLTVVSASTKNSAVHSNQELSFSYRFGDSSGAKSYFFNPDFCGVGESFDLGARKAEGEEPYEIRCKEQLKNIANSLGSAYKQGREITVAGDHEPIGSLSGGYFSGKYDGGGKAITLRSVKTADLQGIGLFGVTRNADLENIKVNYGSANVNLSNFGKKVGFGGVVGIAIGGNINNCEVTDVSVTATNNSADLAIGGIAGYSSADITDCVFGGGSGETFKVDASNNTSAQYTVSVGGIAGSASGRISGTYNPAGDSSTCMVRSLVTDLNTYMKTVETDLTLPNVIFAGGIAGNNVDFIGGTHLEVSGCVSHATLRRGQLGTLTKIYEEGILSEKEVSYEGVIANSSIFISPIAPTEIKLPTNLLDHKELFYNTGTNLDSRIQDFREMILKLIFGDSSSGGKVSFVTGAGVLEDKSIDTTITGCYYYEGMNYYDSQLGGSGATAVRPADYTATTLDDVNLTLPGYIPEHREQEKPIVGLYSLYEKPDGSLYAKVYYNGENVNDDPQGDLDPLERYGVIASLGRIDDSKLSISVSKGGSATAINTVGKVYSDLDGNPISKSEGGGSEVTYFDFSDYVFDEPGTYTVTAVYDGEEIFRQNVRITAREPYVGIYELYELLENDGSKRISGSYTDRKNVGFTADGTYLANKMTAEGDIAGEYGIMIEHSLNKPRALGDVTVKLNGEVIAQSRLDPIGVGAYASNSGDPKSYGKMFDFYKFDDELIEALAEGKEFTIEVCPNEGGEPLAKETFTKNVKIPYLGLFGVLESDPPLKARVVYREPDGTKVNILEYNAETGKKFMRYGVMLEKGFDVTKLKVELYDKDGSLKHTVLGENLTAAANYDIVENKGKVDSVNGKKYNIYKLDEKLTEKVYSFKITYTSTEEVSTELNVDVEDDLKGSPTGHKHRYDDNWTPVKDNEKEHERFCIDEDCDNYEGSREVKEHEMRDIVVKSPTKTEPGLRRYWCVKCDYEYTEEFDSAPYVGIFATYYKYKVDDSVEVGEGEEPSYILDESTKYLAYIVTGNDNIKVLPGLSAGEYYKLTGEFGVVLENNVNKDQFFVQKINGGGYKSDKLRTFSVDGLALVNGGEITPGLEFYTLADDGNINKGDSVSITYDPAELPDGFDAADFKENIPENVSGAPVERAGIYVKNNNGYNEYAWYRDNTEGGNVNGLLIGEAGILIPADSADLIQVYVDNVKVDSALLSDGSVEYGVSHHYGYDVELKALAIDKSVFGYKEEVTITIMQNKTTIFSKTVRIREKIGKNVLIYRKRAYNRGADVWYPAKKPDISNSEYIAEIGVAMPEDYIPRGVKVFVEEKEVTNDLVPEGNPGIDTSQFAGYNLTTYKIPDSYTKGLEFVTVKIVYNDETLQSQRIQIRVHEHTLSAWRQAKDGEDVNFHYQDCTDSNCDDMYFKKQEEHKKDEGVIIKEATETEDGLIQYTCPVCQYKWPVEKYKYEAGPPKMAILFVNKENRNYYVKFSDGKSAGVQNDVGYVPCCLMIESSRIDDTLSEKLSYKYSWGGVLKTKTYNNEYDGLIPPDLDGYSPYLIFDESGFHTFYYSIVVYYNDEEAARFVN